MKLSSLLNNFDDLLDEYRTIEFFGGTLKYTPSRVLKAVDKIAYRTEFLNYIDALGIDIDIDEVEQDITIEDYINRG